MVQKSPACTIGDLAQALIEIFEAKTKVRTIGTRHGEKLFETLLIKEEFLVAEDLGSYYRVLADKRSLNYDKYFVAGDKNLSATLEYTSYNTHQLSVAQIKEKLLSLDILQRELKDWRK